MINSVHKAYDVLEVFLNSGHNYLSWLYQKSKEQIIVGMNEEDANE